MTRRRPSWQFATAVAVVTVLLAACTGGDTTRKRNPSSKPNVVFILTDDLSLNLLQYMPRVQAMQQAGSSFSNYYVVDSLCCPSRAAIFTGEYPHDDGVFTNTGEDGGYRAFNRLGNQPKTFAVALQQAGYRTALMGKYLNGYEPTDPVPPGWDEWDVAGDGYKQFNYRLNENGKVRKYGKDPQDYLTDVMSRKAVSFIGAAADAGKPFLLELSTFTPHRPNVAAPRDLQRFPGLTLPRGPSYDTLPTGAPAWLQRIPPLTAHDKDDMDREYRRRAQSVIAIDDMLGRVQRELSAHGLAKNTFIVFSSDNGFHMGEHRLRAGKQTAYDTDIKVPLIVTGPGVQAGRTITQMSSGVDLAPTFLTIAGAPIAPRVDGVSLLPLWGGTPPADWREAVLVEHHGMDMANSDPDKTPPLNGNPPTYAAIRTATSLYVEYVTGERELYDLTADPDQLHNLAGTSAAARLGPLHDTLTALVNCHDAVACRAASSLD